MRSLIANEISTRHMKLRTVFRAAVALYSYNVVQEDESRRSLTPVGHLSSNADFRRAKRSKISNACDACQRRKSRCELVNEMGCHRCRILRTRCSLAGQSIPAQSAEASPPPVHSQGAGHGDLPLALDRLTATIEGLTQRMAAGGESLRSIGRPIGFERNPGSRAPGERSSSSHPLQGHTRVSLSTAALVAKGLNLQSQSRMTDAVMVGVVSRMVLEEACRA